MRAYARSGDAESGAGHEIKRIETVAEQVGMTIPIGLRINPNFSFSEKGACRQNSASMKTEHFRFLRTMRTNISRRSAFRAPEKPRAA
ncbi:MAG: hypothetical protein DUD39_01875 [Coriobacteriaceae bacterium]|nr:MAG: hypothetical protein DUD39_01875 [Coriobacteriaceae bacterium]